jgi:hypothetical protein
MDRQMMDEIRTTAAKKNAPLIKRLGKTASTSTKYGTGRIFVFLV